MTGNVKFDQKKRTVQPAQALVEVAIVLPMLLLLVLGALDFGRMFFTKIVLTNAAREATSYLSRFPDDKEIDPVSNINFSKTRSIIKEEGSSSGMVLDCLAGTYNGIDTISCNGGVKVHITWPVDELCGITDIIDGCVEVKISKPVDLIFKSFFQSLNIADLTELSSTVRMVIQ